MDWEKSLKSAVEDSKCSGFYCYDEQYLRLNGKRFYRLSLIDSILNKPIAEEIFDNLKYGTVKSFIKRAISDKPVYAITTDHRRKYKTILDGLKISKKAKILSLLEK